MTQQKANAEQKQKLKKYLVFAVMFLVFAGSMWWIFAPSESDKEAEIQGVGFNADIPDPKGAEIVGDKKTAYEQEQARVKQDEKMRSLQDYSYMLGERNDTSEAEQVDIEPTTDYPSGSYSSSPYNSSGYSSRRGNSFDASNSAYMDINRTLDSFYEEPAKEQDEQAQLALEWRIQELERKLEEEATKKNAVDDQLALMEKSYQLAAKYMPGTNGTQSATDNISSESNTTSGKKTDVVSISHIKQNVVSSLNQPMSDLEFVKQFSEERNLEFNTVAASNNSKEKNTINAVVHGDQTLINGQSVTLRLTEPMRAGKHIIPRNTILTGMGKISGERLEIAISSIEYDGSIIQVSMEAYDSDGQQGIYIPGSMEMTAVKEIAGNMGQNLGTTINITEQGAGEQLLSDLGRGVIQGTSQYISQKARQVKVTLKAGYRIFLLPNDNN